MLQKTKIKMLNENKITLYKKFIDIFYYNCTFELQRMFALLYRSAYRSALQATWRTSFSRGGCARHRQNVEF